MNPTQKKALETKIKRLDGEIEQFNAELAEIVSKLADSDIYDDKRKHELKTLLASQTKLQGRLEVAEAEWLSLNEQLEA